MSKRKSSYNGASQEYYWKAPRTDNQKHYVDSLEHNTITLCIAPPGCGKTLFALQAGLQLYSEGEIDKIYYVRNNCGMQTLGSKGRGELPGGVLEKAAPLLGPAADNLYELVVRHKAEYILGNGVLEPLLYEDLRGRSFANSFIIADEAQNVPPLGIVTLLTRLGRNTKMVLIGDCSQKDLGAQYRDGLDDAYRRLSNVEGIGLVVMGIEDVQRNQLLKTIMLRYNQI